MQSKATTVAAYLASLPADRRSALEAVRKVIKKNLDPKFEEGMQYGMIGYYLPHSVYPAGYHCDPKQPLPYAGLASQKNHMSIYLMGLYIGEEGSENELTRWFHNAWAKTGKKLDMGKSCVRFKKIEDVSLDVLGEAIRRVPAKTYVANYEAVLATSKGSRNSATKGQAPAQKAPAKLTPAKLTPAKLTTVKKTTAKKTTANPKAAKKPTTGK